MLKNWISIFRTCNTVDNKIDNLDFISWWLIIGRACVFVMTVLSAFIGGLYVYGHVPGGINWFNFLLVLIGLVFAHHANNLVNDYYDLKQDVDTDGYVRGEYSPHPISSGLITPKGLFVAVVIMDLVDFLISLYLSVTVGWAIMVFALIGIGISVFYVAPPLKLKYHGFGEFAIFLIWGPLIIMGTIYAVGGPIDFKTFLFSVPYGLAVTAVVVGKHLDKREADEKKGVHTLPVILGHEKGIKLMKLLVISFYLFIVILPLFGVTSWWVLLSLISVPKALRLFQTLDKPKPKDKNEAFELAADVIPKDMKDKYHPDDPDSEVPLWPLWFVAWGVWWDRIAGGIFVLSLIIDAIASKF